MKRIVIIDQSDFISTPIGGSTTFLRTIVPHLSNRYDVSLIGRTSLADQIGTWTSDYLGKARFFGIGHIGKRSKIIPGRIQTLLQLWQARSIIKGLHADLLYFHQTETALPFITYHTGKKILHIHGLANPLSVSRFPLLRNKLFQNVYNFMFRRVEHSVDAIISVSSPNPSDTNEIKLTNSCPFRYIPVCIDGNIFSPSDKHSARIDLNLPGSVKIIGFVGRLSRKKNLEATLEAVQHLKQQGMAIHLIIVGDGEHEAILRKFCIDCGIAGNVTFFSGKPYNELVRYYNAMDLFVMTSLAEGFPMVVLEALASGTPVVANNIGAIPEVITNGQNGYILDSLTPSSVAKAISSALAEGDPMSTNARTSSEPYFAEHIANKITLVFDTLLAGDKPL